MGDEDDPGPGLTGGVSDQPMTGQTGGGRKPRGRLVTRPDQPPPLGAEGAGGRCGPGRPAGAVGVEAVIDGQGQQRTALRPCPVGGKVQQGDGIAAAGQGDDDRIRAVGPKAGAQPGLGVREPVGVAQAQPGRRAGVRAGAAGARAGVQAKRAPSSVARVRWAAEAVAA